MPITEIADPKQLAILNAVLDDVCAAAGIDMHAPEREAAASLVMKFYWNGYRTTDELKLAIEEARERLEAKPPSQLPCATTMDRQNAAMVIPEQTDGLGLLLAVQKEMDDG